MFQSNILKWYTFEKDKKIIQIGKDKINPDQKYDYIIIYGYENYDGKLEDVVQLLSEDGKLLIIGNNDFGINNWSKYSEEAQKSAFRTGNVGDRKRNRSYRRKQRNGCMPCMR